MDLLSASTSPALGPMLSAGPSSSHHDGGGSGPHSVHGGDGDTVGHGHHSHHDLAPLDDGSSLIGTETASLVRSHSDHSDAHAEHHRLGRMAPADTMLDLDDHAVGGVGEHAHAHHHHHMHDERHRHSDAHSGHGHSHGHDAHRHRGGRDDAHDDPLSSLDGTESISMDLGMDIGGLLGDTSSSSGVGVGVGDGGLLLQSTSPLLLSAGAPLIGDFMPGMSLADLGMGNASPDASGPASKVAAAALVHNQIESLEAMRAKLEADLAEEMRAKQMTLPAALSDNGAAGPAAAAPPRKRVRSAAGAAAASKARWAKKYAAQAAAAAAAEAAAAAAAAAAGSTADSAPASAPGAADAPASTAGAPAPPAAPGVVAQPTPAVHRSERRGSQSSSKDVLVSSSVHTASLLPPGILSCTDESMLQSLLDALASTFGAQSRSGFLPRYLKLSLPEVQKEIAFLENDLTRKRTKYAQMITGNGTLSHKKGAAAALAAAAAHLGEPTPEVKQTIAAAGAQLLAANGQGSNGNANGNANGNGQAQAAGQGQAQTNGANGKPRRKTSQGVANAVASLKRKSGGGAAGGAGANGAAGANGGNSATPATPGGSDSSPSDAGSAAPVVLPSAAAASRAHQRGSHHHRNKFVPSSCPSVGQIVCVCRKPYDGTPVNGAPPLQPQQQQLPTTAAQPADATTKSEVAAATPAIGSPMTTEATPNATDAAPTAPATEATEAAKTAPDVVAGVPPADATLTAAPSASPIDGAVAPAPAPAPSSDASTPAALAPTPAAIPASSDPSGDTPMPDATVAASATPTTTTMVSNASDAPMDTSAPNEATKQTPAADQSPSTDAASAPASTSTTPSDGASAPAATPSTADPASASAAPAPAATAVDTAPADSNPDAATSNIGSDASTTASVATADAVPPSTAATPSVEAEVDVTPPMPYLIPCQRCNAWFHPSCLRLSPLEALTPYVCRKHATATDAPALRQLMRPTSSRHERLLEREKTAEIVSPNVLSPTSAFYVPEAVMPCPPLPDDNGDDTRDNRLFVALREMMCIYHLSQHDVCISSNLSGGQAALSSLINARKIANIGRKQNQLRRWLWKFEQYQKLWSEHAIKHNLPRPAIGAPLAGVDPPLRAQDGSLVQVGTVVAGHTVDWPPVIKWRSYFDALTDEEKAADEAKRIAAVEAHQQRMAEIVAAKAAAKAAAAAAAAVNAQLRAAASLSSSAPSDASSVGTNGSSSGAVSGSMSRLRGVHHAPQRYVRGSDDEGDSARGNGAAGAAATSSAAVSAATSETDEDRSTSGSTTDRKALKRKSGALSLADGADPESFSHRYNIGDKLSCRVTPASDSPWLDCTVRDVRSCAVLLHFLRCSDAHDQWVNTRSKRLGEFGMEKKRAAANAANGNASAHADLPVEEIVKQAYKEYVKAEREAARSGHTGGAPLWSGKKRPDLKAGVAVASAAAARKRTKVASASSSAAGSADEVNTNADECGVCGKRGNLLCCDGCPRSYHGQRTCGSCGSCLDPPVNVRALVTSGEEWFCMKCVGKKRKVA